LGVYPSLVYSVYVMNADGSDPRLVAGPCAIETPGEGFVWCQSLHPACAPDGAQLAVTRYTDDGVFGAQNRFLASLPAKSSFTENVLYRGSAFTASPDWSRDGKEMVFSQNLRDGRIRVFALTLETGAVRELIPDDPRALVGKYDDWQPVWSRARN
jgi:Tol biopolymer transport system component